MHLSHSDLWATEFCVFFQCTARFVILHLWIFSLSVCHCICQISNHTCWHLVTPDKYWLCTVNRGGGETAINKVSWKTHVHKCTEYLKLWSKQSRATFEVKVTVYVNVSLWHCGQIIEWCMVSLKAERYSTLRLPPPPTPPSSSINRFMTTLFRCSFLTTEVRHHENTKGNIIKGCWDARPLTNPQESVLLWYSMLIWVDEVSSTISLSRV